VVACADLGGAARTSGLVALHGRGCAVVLSANEVGGQDVLPGRCADRLRRDRNALAHQTQVALLDGLPVAVLQAGRKVWVASSARTPNVPSVATSRYGAGVPSPKEAKLSPTAGRKLSITSIDRKAPSVGAPAVALLTEQEDRAAVEVGEVPAEVHVDATQGEPAAAGVCGEPVGEVGFGVQTSGRPMGSQRLLLVMIGSRRDRAGVSNNGRVIRRHLRQSLRLSRDEGVVHGRGLDGGPA